MVHLQAWLGLALGLDNLVDNFFKIRNVWILFILSVSFCKIICWQFCLALWLAGLGNRTWSIAITFLISTMFLMLPWLRPWTLSLWVCQCTTQTFLVFCFLSENILLIFKNCVPLTNPRIWGTLEENCCPTRNIILL